MTPYDSSVRVWTRAKSLARRLAAVAFARFNTVKGEPDSPTLMSRSKNAHTDMRPFRESIAVAFLRGDGSEIGMLHSPLRVPTTAHVKYVDQMPVPELRRQYPELGAEAFVEPDIIDDGERLTTIGDSTQDFVIANHFLEHCQNPVLAPHNLLRVLKSAAVLYPAAPAKRFTFDVDRSCTTSDHFTQILFREQSGPNGTTSKSGLAWLTNVRKPRGKIRCGFVGNESSLYRTLGSSGRTASRHDHRSDEAIGRIFCGLRSSRSSTRRCIETTTSLSSTLTEFPPD